MFGRSRPPATGRTNGTFGGFLVKNVIILLVSFVLAFYFATQLLAYTGWFLVPLAGVLGLLVPQANDPFWISYILIYALISIFVMFFRFKTGSRV